MTSTPVRSSDSLMNLVGKTAQTTFSGIKNAGGTSFGDVMGKTSGSDETAAAAQNVKKTGNTGESIRDKLGSAGKSTQTLKPKNGVKEKGHRCSGRCSDKGRTGAGSQCGQGDERIRGRC